MTSAIVHQRTALSRPLVVTGDLRDVTYTIAPDFTPYPSAGAARLNWCVMVKDARTIRNVHIVGHDGGWLHQWDVPLGAPLPPPEPGIPAWLGGLLVRDLEGTIDNVTAYGLPGRPLQVEASTDSRVGRLAFNRCFSGPRFGPTGEHRRLVVDDVVVGDCWMPWDLKTFDTWSDVYGVYREGAEGDGIVPACSTGGSTLILANARGHCDVRNVRRVPGTEGKGMKLNMVEDLLVEHCSPGGTIQVAGPSARVLIRRCTIDLDGGYRKRPREYNGLHVFDSQAVWIHDSELRGAGEGKHAIWSDNSQVVATSCRGYGWQEPTKAVRGGTIDERGCALGGE